MAHKPTDTTIIDGSKNPVDGNAVYDYVGAGGPFLPLAGGTLTGALTVPSVNLLDDPKTNTKYGYRALESNTIGYNNVAIGRYSLWSNISGDDNIAVGNNALQGNISGYYNIALGSSSLTVNTEGVSNIALGQASLLKNTSGDYNIAVGQTALQENVIGDGNIGIGSSSLGASTGNSNTAIGYGAMLNLASGSNCIALGFRAGCYNLNSNKLYIDSIGRANTAGDDAGAIITGTMDATPANQTLTINATTTVSNTITATQFKLSALNTAPASATATGTLGEIRIASGFIYICVAANTWQRAAIATW